MIYEYLDNLSYCLHSVICLITHKPLNLEVFLQRHHRSKLSVEKPCYRVGNNFMSWVFFSLPK